MQKERLVIKYFGPIKEADLEISRLTVLIGEQATGKSVVAKLLAVCRYFSYILEDDSLIPAIQHGIEAWGLQECYTARTFVSYECKDYLFTFQSITAPIPHVTKKNGVEIEYESPLVSSKLHPKSQRFRKLLSELKKITPKRNGGQEVSNWVIPSSFYSNDVSNVMENPFFMPTERGLQSIFSLGRHSIQNISDFLFNYFAKVNGIQGKFIEEVDIEYLNLQYKTVKGKGRFRKKGVPIWFSMANAPSGFQTSIPIILVFKYYTELLSKAKTIIIDEPEIGLYPSAQYELVKALVSRTFNYCPTGRSKTLANQLLVTTHSPYILSSLNALLSAFQAGKKDSKKTATILSNRYWLNPSNVSAYRLNRDGGAVNIFDKKQGLIAAETIDEISIQLNKDFESFLDIELGDQ